MEQPPGIIDDLQPQDLSMSSSASVNDLTKKGEGCISSKVPSVDTLQAASNWCPISSASNPSLTSDILLQSGEDHIRPDIALSNTTVTVSYVSRSHVISSHESLSQHLPLCGMPAVRKLHLCPPGYADTGIRETGIPLDQQYSDEGNRPVVLATQTELFHTLSAAQVGQQSFGSDLMQDTNEVNGGAVSPDWVLNEHSLPQAKAKGLENGQIDSCSSSGVCAEWSPETGTPAAGEDEDTGGAEVLFLMSKTKDSVLLPDGLATGDLCSQERDFISPLDDPVSPSPTSQDDVEEMFVLPQASSSPSGDNSYPQMENESAWDGTSTRCTNPLDSLDVAATAKFQSSDKDTAPVQKQKAPVINLTVDDGTSNNVESRTATSHMNGNAETLHMPLEGKKLAACSGRGTQSEAATVDMNLNSQFTNDEEDTPLKRNRMRKAKVLVTAQQAAKVPVTKRKAADTSTDNHQDSTSDSEANSLRKLPSSTRPKSPRLTAKKKIFPSPERLSLPLVSSAAKRNVSPLSATSPKKSWGEAKGRSAGLKTPSTTKRKGGSTPRTRRRKRRPSPTSNMFSPKEPEIKLRYINFKEKRQCGSVDNFSPFVHVERQPQQQPSLCTVINYPEEVSRATQPRSRQPTQPGGFVCTAVPSTSCLQLGRMALHGQHQRVLVCCLCGLSANAMYLGDLHGPYYPEGFQSAAKSGEAGSERLQCKQGDECDDSDASSRSIRTRRRKRAIPPRSQSSGITLKGRDLRTKRRRSTDGPSASPSKWARPDAGSSTTCSAEDWYSPPLLPADPCEFWLHEDCGIWSTGVFLVGGRVYGLKEAVKAAQETTCSACRHPGATLGCFFKSCPYKYHYRCALESDCVLVEENFSMKCKKHKNKTFKAPPGNRLDDR